MKKTLLLSSLLWAAAPFLMAQNPGDFLISEFMANPENVPDDLGEYIELYNARPYPVTLQGCTLQDGSGLYVTIDQSIWVPGYQLALIGGNATPGAIFYYPENPPPFSLNNTGGDQITLTCNGVVVAQTTYTQPQPAGQARELITTIGHPSGFTSESQYRDADNTFRYIGANASDNGSPTLPGNMFVLPVELSQFEAQIQNGEVFLQWTTESELNNSHFNIEHSYDGRHFKQVGQRSGYGNSQTRQHYQFRHQPKQQGLQYYRLAQYDYDGTKTYSDIINIRLGRNNQLIAYPTNTQGPLHLQWQQPTPPQSQLLILNTNGQLQQNLQLPHGSRATILNVQNLPPGPYIAQLKSPRRTTSTRFFKN